jgi:PKD repeat protein
MFHWRRALRVLPISFGFLTVVSFLFTGCNNNDITGTGSKPTVTGMTPSSVVPGQQDVTGHITGTNFNGIIAVDLGSGINVKSTDRISATELTVKFSVNSDATPGPRQVRVATPDGIATNDTLLSISDNRVPVAQFTLTPASGALGTDITFDASGSNDPDGNITTFSWAFGDGATDTGKLVHHAYQSAGTFHPKLTVKDNHGSTAEATRDVSISNTRPPVPHFNVTPSHGDVHTNFKFDGTSSTDDGRIVRWDWSFGDGAKEQGKIIHHQYSHSGDFNVTLKVTDNDNLTNDIEKTVGIRGKAPVAAFSVTPSFGDIGTIFTFDGSNSHDSDGNIVAYDWNMGDGTKLGGKVVTHKYSTQGVHSVELAVTDNDGLESFGSRDVSIDPPVPSGGLVCTTPADRPSTGIYGTVLEVNQGAGSVLMKLQYTDHHGITFETYNCSNAFFKCGDLDPKGETSYYGEICKMVYYGNNTFRIYTKGAKSWPFVGQKDVFLKWQTCGIHSVCP